MITFSQGIPVFCVDKDVSMEPGVKHHVTVIGDIATMVILAGVLGWDAPLDNLFLVVQIRPPT